MWCGQYIPWTKKKTTLIQHLELTPRKKYVQRYYQLKVGHGAVGNIFLNFFFLDKIGRIETRPVLVGAKNLYNRLSIYIYAKCRTYVGGKKISEESWLENFEKEGVRRRPAQLRLRENWLAGLRSTR